jgi:hypothetical protein
MMLLLLLLLLLLPLLLAAAHLWTTRTRQIDRQRSQLR